jgi:hypothetical protein
MYYYNTPTLTFEDDFSTDNATDRDSSNIGVNTSTGRWEFDFKRDSSNDASALDLGSALSNTQWVMDFDMYLNAVSLGNIWGTIAVSNEDETSSRAGTSKHCINMSIGGGTSSTDDQIGLGYEYNSGMGAVDDVQFTGLTTSHDLTLLYFRMRRTSETTADLTMYSDSARTVVIETIERTDVNASSVGYRYITLHNYDNIGGGSGTLTGYFDNIKVYDGVTSPDNAWKELGT